MRRALRTLYLDASRTRAVPEGDPAATAERYCGRGDLVPDDAVQSLGLVAGVDVESREGDRAVKAIAPSADKALKPGADK